MKVCSIISSRREKSNTEKILELFISKLKEQVADQIEHIKYVGKELEIERCCGCLNCFNSGYCPLDRKDAFDEVKDNILASDVFVLGSPVYAGMINSDMKTIVDRLSYWLHLMPLSGKRGVVIITASSNSIIETDEYLHRIMESLGVSVICDILCTVDAPPMLNDVNFITKTIPHYVNKLVNSISEDRLSASKYQMMYFDNLKKAFEGATDDNNAEVKYWKENRIKDYDNYTDYLLKHKKY